MPDGGTGFVLVRSDRVRCVKGGDKLQEHRLKPDSPTRRVLATCCNSPMFLEFSKRPLAVDLPATACPMARRRWKCAS